MSRVLLWLTAVGMLAAACGGSAGPEFGRADAEALTQMARDFAAAYNTKDAAKTASFSADNAVLLPPNSSMIRGADSIRGFYEIRFTEGATDLRFEVRDVGGHGPLAYLSGDFSVRNAPPGKPEWRDRGKFLWIARNFNGQWRWEYQMWSSDLPPPSAR